MTTKFTPALKNISNITRRRFYKQPYLRLQSFEQAPNYLKSAADKLSTAGFYHTAKKLLSCHRCNLQLYPRQINTINPVQQHHKWSPNCPFIKQRSSKIKKIRTLTNTIHNKRSRLIAQDYFQAVHRFKHYMTFPFMTIDDISIDRDANEFWSVALHNDIKSSYKILKQQRRQPLQDSAFRPTNSSSSRYSATVVHKSKNSTRLDGISVLQA